jgi:hypothetical protein
MSHGPGHVQRAILALIEADPNGAWATGALCAHVYGVERVEKRHRVAVIRALRRMMRTLPAGWCVSRQGGPPHEHCLFNQHSVEGHLRAVWLWKYSEMSVEAFGRSETAKDIVANVEKLRRYRDADDIGKLDMHIADEQERLDLAEQGGDRASIKKSKERLAQLWERRRNLQRARNTTEVVAAQERYVADLAARRNRRF